MASKRAEIWEKKRRAFLQLHNGATESADSEHKLVEIEKCWNESRAKEPPQPIKPPSFKLEDKGKIKPARDRNRTDVKVLKPTGGDSSMDLSWSTSARTHEKEFGIAPPKIFNPITGTPRVGDLDGLGAASGKTRPGKGVGAFNTAAKTSADLPVGIAPQRAEKPAAPPCKPSAEQIASLPAAEQAGQLRMNADTLPHREQNLSGKMMSTRRSPAGAEPNTPAAMSVRAPEPERSVRSSTRTSTMVPQDTGINMMQGGRETSARQHHAPEVSAYADNNVLSSRSGAEKSTARMASHRGGAAELQASASNVVKPLNLTGLREPGVANGFATGTSASKENHAPLYSRGPNAVADTNSTPSSALQPGGTPTVNKVATTSAGRGARAAVDLRGSVNDSATSTISAPQPPLSAAPAGARRQSTRTSTRDQRPPGFAMYNDPSSAPAQASSGRKQGPVASVVSDQATTRSTARSSVLRERAKRGRSPTGKIGGSYAMKNLVDTNASVQVASAPPEQPVVIRKPPGGGSSICFG
ncbi:unnamed protein product [Amoebophrya sp. A120]|nr:unnamed protein product [Amoebophrya sp. A120]|eukprot:GSA120T00011699001.1